MITAKFTRFDLLCGPGFDLDVNRHRLADPGHRLDG